MSTADDRDVHDVRRRRCASPRPADAASPSTSVRPRRAIGRRRAASRPGRAVHDDVDAGRRRPRCPVTGAEVAADGATPRRAACGRSRRESTRTSWPAATSRGTSSRPRLPVPPVTRTVGHRLARSASLSVSPSASPSRLRRRLLLCRAGRPAAAGRAARGADGSSCPAQRLERLAAPAPSAAVPCPSAGRVPSRDPAA